MVRVSASMAERPATPALLVFGPQAALPDIESLSRLRLVLVSEPRLSSFLDAVGNLPQLWRSLVTVLPGLEAVPGLQVLEKLVSWIHGETSFPHTLRPLPNVLLTPLTVIMQITNYVHYLRVMELRNEGTTHQGLLDSIKDAGAQGLCIGILSAISLACSADEADLGTLGAVALRLALCVGAVVDLEGAFAVSPNEASCFAVHCDASQQDVIQRILEQFPEAYVSVQVDTVHVTITAPRSTTPLLMQYLSAAGLVVRPIALEGRFHTSRHEEALSHILGFCNSNPELQFPSPDQLRVPVRSNTDARLLTDGFLHEAALRSILTERPDWHVTITEAAASLNSELNHVLAIGTANFIPHSILQSNKLRATYLQSFESARSFPMASIGMQETTDASKRNPSGDDIAIIGMACRFPGAASVEGFWDLLCAGKSMCRELPTNRFSMQRSRRTGTNSGDARHWGNFLDDPDVFDHRFFNMSSREAASTDPQQRLVLQVAYEAMESAGYFDELAKPSSMGCYLGVGSVDYHDNVASHPPTAFSALGTLRAFISGKVSHYFGWTGPSITYDTACSSSAVAIHSACMALRSGECSAALAGGVHLITSPALYQNLDKGGFLSKTGPSKAFDAQADGYCRGEGAGLVVLKKLSAAIADGDAILGVIAGSAVGQNENCTPITVPHSPSQVKLYRKAVSMAGLDPREISFVEAHGTGTKVGDPIECESIRHVFGGSQRREKLYFGSLKANIGHTEGASGAAGLIKSVLMIQKGMVPVQANFSVLNPKIPSLVPDKMAIPTSTQSWKCNAICVNNYGAAGSNAALIVCAPPVNTGSTNEPSKPGQPIRYPISISAQSSKSLHAYCVALWKSLSNSGPGRSDLDIASVAFNLAHKSNRSLATTLNTTACSVSELRDELSAFESGRKQFKQLDPKARKPVVLSFGGQTTDAVGLNEEVYRNTLVLRNHLDRCDALCRALGGRSLFPGIFSKSPVQDIVSLHSMVFALQYSCAMAWIDCGLPVDTLIGHSFGQFTALCVSGSLSLEHTMRLVMGRASLIRDLWGSEKGAMMAVDANAKELSEILSLTQDSNPDHEIEIACYNSATSHVLVGSTESIQAAEHVVKVSPTLSQSVKVKRLKVTHGYHSYLLDTILPELVKIADGLEFHEPQIPIETTTRDQSWRVANSALIAQHSREAVYFSNAVHRIENRHGACIWLEAGSDSTITNMARRALGLSSQAAHIFQPVSLTSVEGLGQLADATVNLWNAGVNLQFWPFHRRQRQHYTHVNLPPYQFEKSRHWLEYEEPVQSSLKTNDAQPDEEMEAVRELLALTSFVTPPNESLAEFAIDPQSDGFKTYVSGHSVLGKSLCPASLYIHLAAKAASMVTDEAKMAESTLSVENLELHNPLGIDAKRTISMKLKASNTAPLVWSFEISSYQTIDLLNRSCHATGTIYTLPSADHALRHEFSRYERLTSDRYSNLLSQNEMDDAGSSIEGSIVYKAFSSVVNYSGYFQGVRKVTSRGSESAGRVRMPDTPSGMDRETLWDPLLVDNFLQVAGLHVNCLRDKLPTDIYICTKVNQLKSSSHFSPEKCGMWSVFSSFEQVSEKDLINDIFVFEPATKRLVIMILGARFTKVSTTSLEKALSRVNAHGKLSSSNPLPAPIQPPQQATVKRPAEQRVSPPASRVEDVSVSVSSDSRRDVFRPIRQLLNRVTDVPTELVQDDSALETIGLDSLMTTEVLDELNKTFHISVAIHEIQALTNFKSLCLLVQSKAPLIFPVEGQVEAGATVGFSKIGGVDSPAREESWPYSSEEPFAEIELRDFGDIQHDFDRFADKTRFADFYTEVYPRQAELVVSYVTEAFESLGCPLSQIAEDEELPPVLCLPRHRKVMRQFYNSLSEADLIRFEGSKLVRTGKQLNATRSEVLLENILRDFPQHISEHKLLSSTGHVLADCLSGKTDALHILFNSRANRELLGDVYTNAPMFATGTRLLGDFLLKVTPNNQRQRPIRILEIGAGTGGTTKDVSQQLSRQGISFTYTFTDISSSLVAAAKKRFASQRDSIEFMVLNIEEDPPAHLLDSQDIIISTNCIHATKRLEHSSANIHKMLRTDGILCLIELTRNLYWFDLVFGLLEGWWLFEDSRTHALAHESFWEKCLQAVGFKQVNWSDGRSRESDLIRLITAVASKPAREIEPQSHQVTQHAPAFAPETSGPAETLMETVLFKQVGRSSLYADIYYPKRTFTRKTKLPIALMVHGGGHVMLSRKDIRLQQMELLRDNGLLPVAIDYRLCPEVDVIEGAMSDVCYALEWARSSLPTLSLQRADIEADGARVVVVGWSAGGTLAMSVGWTAPARGLQPPEAILVFYCPTDYQSESWTRPKFPWGTKQADEEAPYDIWETVRDAPITGFNVASNRAVGGWLSTTDPRARMLLYMNWTGQTLPVLLGAVTSRQKALRRKQASMASAPLPPLDARSTLPLPAGPEIAAISPRAQIVSGAYRTPTYIVHGTADDFIPWRESHGTYEALVAQGVPAGLSIVEGAGHLFEMLGLPRGEPAVGQAVLDGYRFLLERVGLDLLGEYGLGRERW